MINFFPKNIKEYDDTIDKLIRENRKLQKENKLLKEDYSKIVQDNCYTLELEKRIDKAVELLNEPQFEIDNIPCNYENDIEKLKNILRGEDGKKEQQQEITRLNKIIDDLREYMLDIDYKMGWQYAEYLDELLGIKSNYKKYGIAIDLKKEDE